MQRETTEAANLYTLALCKGVTHQVQQVLHSQFDIPELVHEAEVSDDLPIINLGAWNDDPIVIQAIKEKIDLLMN